MSIAIKFALAVLGYLIGFYAFILIAATNWTIAIAIGAVFVGSEIFKTIASINKNKKEVVS